MPLSKLFRCAVEGATTDGRTLERTHIEQMARNYSPQVYGARCNLEHLRSLAPDAVFKMYGDVTQVKAEEIKDGPLAGKLALYAQVDGTDDLVALSKSRQKVYSSVELHPSFADTGEAYLMGLAFTDSPASLGTEMLTFSANAAVNPLAGRKSQPECLFTAAEETSLDFEPEQDKPEAGKGFFARIKEMLGKNQQQFSAENSEIRQAVEAIALAQADAIDAVQRLSGQQSGFASQAALKTVSDDLAALKAQLSQQDGNHSHRPDSSGSNSNSNVQLADC